MAVVEHTVVVSPQFHEFHPDLMAPIALGLDGWVGVKTDEFMDRSPYAKVGQAIRGAAVIPVWLTAPMADSVMRTMELGNALTHHEQGYDARAEELVYVLPFAEGRSDKITQVRRDVKPDESDMWPVLATLDGDRWMVAGETIYAEMFADMIAHVAKASKLLLFEPHSALVHRYFVKNFNEKFGNGDSRVLTLSAVPLFADWLRVNDKVDENTVVLAPDIGALSRAGYLAQILGVPLVICDKWRPKHNSAQVSLKYGNVCGKRVIGVDDIIDTAGTIIDGARVIREEEGASELYVFSTSAKFSGPAISRLDEALRTGLINEVVVTDNLPTANKGKILGSMGFKIIPIADLLLRGIKTLLDPEATFDTYGIRPYLFTNETSLEAYHRLQRQFSLPPL
ncbi:ribose-phosphate diphosphokinase [Candidatus Gottesmanbacteria bacterium]|nr:ribose-phosphate diphosphokinase [Candidatus Gottesmanbacteria bacterium]